jgi:hypothetical protein
LLIQIKFLIDYSNNQITHFTNINNVSLSNYQSDNITQQIFFRNNTVKISFHDGLLEMYNRCSEINSSDSKILMKAIKRIDDDNRIYSIGLVNVINII